jgi:hypothetical protein
VPRRWGQVHPPQPSLVGIEERPKFGSALLFERVSRVVKTALKLRGVILSACELNEPCTTSMGAIACVQKQALSAIDFL